jgi:E3 ubiquitin-protein ligase CCNP1IP1
VPSSRPSVPLVRDVLRSRKTRSSLTTFSVRQCSHIFCVECAERLFGTGKQCPACQSRDFPVGITVFRVLMLCLARYCPPTRRAGQTLLTEPDDVVICSLNPSNDYKTSVLSGLAYVNRGFVTMVARCC